MSHTELGRGVIVPMITPFTKDGKIDIEATGRIIEHLIAAGTAPFILGTTGESASIPEKVRPAFVKAMVEASPGESKTYAGISSPCFQTSVEAANQYFELGVDAVVVHPPSYYPLSDYCGILKIWWKIFPARSFYIIFQQSPTFLFLLPFSINSVIMTE